jgi:hypothetical protein
MVAGGDPPKLVSDVFWKIAEVVESIVHRPKLQTQKSHNYDIHRGQGNTFF